MPKKHAPKPKKNIVRILIAGGCIIAVIAVFLYMKIVYFPSRETIDDLDMRFAVTDGDIEDARSIDLASLSSFTGDYIVSANTLESLERFYKKTKDQKVAL